MSRIVIPIGLVMAFALAGCGGGGSSSTSDTSDTTTQPCATNSSSDTDTDGDGLSDCYEVSIGTSPADTDSDGDGLSDFDEVVTKAFDASINNFQFNPRIADVPEISVQLQSIPDISISYTDNTSTSHTSEVTRTNESSSSLTHSSTYEQSVSQEISDTISDSVSLTDFSVSASTTYSESVQETMAWTTTQTHENSTSLAQMQSATSQSGVTNTGGEIAVLLKVQNHGYQTITLSNMTVTALQVDPNDPTKQKLVTGMDYDTTSGSFPTFDIGPNGESNTLPFKASMTLGKTYDLLRSSRNVIIQPTTWNITDQDGHSYTHNLTNVNARAAQVIIDYDGVNSRQIENRYVATVTDFQKNRLSAATILGTVLNVDYTEGMTSSTYTGTHSGLLSVRDVANKDSIHGRWVVVHNYLDTDGVTRLSKTYDSNVGDYSLDDIQVAKGEVLHLMYYEDQDGDGLGSREEYLHGTSDTDSDSDADGLTDYEEIKSGWTVPVTKDISRTVYSDPTQNDADNDGLVDGDERTKGTNPHERDTDNDGTLDNSDTTLTVADMQEVAFLPLSESEINDSTINSSVSTGGTYSFTTDRFGNANAAINITTDADELDVSNVYSSDATVGGTLVMWVKIDPTLPANGWNLYELKDPVASNANQFFWIYPKGFTVMGDCCDRHSIFANQNTLFTTIPYADWHMLAMVGRPDSASTGMAIFDVYYDGQLYTSIENTGTPVQFLTYPWTFAGLSSYSVGLSEYRGAIDDIRFFKRGLDGEEINLLYEAQ
jgi:hypothetical protein